VRTRKNQLNQYVHKEKKEAKEGEETGGEGKREMPEGRDSSEEGVVRPKDCKENPLPAKEE